jgi:hypothetical protein
MRDKFLSFTNDGAQILETAAIQSAGVADGGKIPQLDPATGRFHPSMMPAGVGISTIVLPASEALAAGDFVNNWWDTTAPATMRCRKADSTNGREANGFVLAAVNSGSPATIYLQGINTGLSGLTPATSYFLGAAGGVTNTPSLTTAGHIVQHLGDAFSVSSINFEYLKPTVIG